ncbi:hypothetical protein RhiirA5_432523 [Rhizophagus irregularis]|uniref:Uncharacterized protein n=1 Tax=Rhizophagus irregularis TaxID=588596 RepID=A0A2N0QRC3_9GLOM|nr:hypothetical protein RhiirA5_432523 [Rhizophagus irregularis]PKC53607.1 hypothetical protein RhiirA1_478950 [Rhizophagus irregularis]CAB5185561.1 unnamed protein product [Rhizophagus irregularis]
MRILKSYVKQIYLILADISELVVTLTLNKFNLDVSYIINKIDFLLKEKNIKKNSERFEFLAKINSKRAADSIEYILHSSNLNEGIDEEFLNELFPAESIMGLTFMEYRSWIYWWNSVGYIYIN